MFNNFFGKPDPKEQQRQVDRSLRKASREIERDRRELEKEEKKLELEIKKLAKEGNNEGCRILAKQLVQLRKQKTRTYAANSKLQGVSVQTKAMGANVKLADAMAVAGKSMGQMNQLMNPAQIGATMQEFSKQGMKMDMTEEMMNDAFDDILADSDEETESNDIVTQVLDEIGIEMSGKMSGVPLPEQGKIDMGSSSKDGKLTDSEIEAQLSKLRS
ncbi:charged multivesicular body protein 2b [Atheta coriaria]|uniref:charged multivesicular body protein 2b n=1 Tax=Dalotia coriaria TaxID=877792 RepID=UPI0031F3709C